MKRIFNLLFSKKAKKSYAKHLIEVALTSKNPSAFVLLKVDGEYCLQTTNNLDVSSGYIEVVYSFFNCQFELYNNLD